MPVGDLRIKFAYDPPEVKRRRTLCRIHDASGVLGSGLTKCSRNDQFVKSTGRKLALARAMQDARLDREARRLLWAQYLGRSTHGLL